MIQIGRTDLICLAGQCRFVKSFQMPLTNCDFSIDYGVVNRSADSNGSQYILGIQGSTNQLQPSAINEEEVRALSHFQGADIGPPQKACTADGIVLSY